MSDGEIILYKTEDGQTEIQLRAVDGTVWLTQAQMSDLFDTSKQNISLHLNNVISDGELAPDSVVKESLIPATDGKAYRTNTYNLDVILAVGYRVRSPRSVQFRRWASTLLERIRDIRASEVRFYQKVRDILALSEDYDPKSPTMKIF